MARPNPKRQILTFLALTFGLGFLIQILIIIQVGTTNTFLMFPLMWVPGAVALWCSNHFGNRFRDLAFVAPGRRSLITAYVIPISALILTCLILILLKIGEFHAPTNWFRTLIFQPTLGVLFTGLFVLGEELGWRGFLHNQFSRLHFRDPVLIISALWAIWHWPLILFSNYAPSPYPLLSLASFTICIVSFGVILGWLRNFSRSVFPCILAHAVHDTGMQNILPDLFTPGELTPYFSGEAGFILPLIYLVTAVGLTRFSARPRRHRNP